MIIKLNQWMNANLCNMLSPNFIKISTKLKIIDSSALLVLLLFHNEKLLRGFTSFFL